MSVSYLKLLILANDNNVTAFGQADFLITEDIRKLNIGLMPINWLKTRIKQYK